MARRKWNSVQKFHLHAESFGSHIKHVVRKAEQKVPGLIRLMPDFKGSSSERRAVLCSAIHYLLLHCTSVYGRKPFTSRNIYRRIFEKAQGGMLKALEVIVAATLFDFLVQARAIIYERRCADRKSITTRAKSDIMAEWQRKWNIVSGRIAEWLTCSHRQIVCHLTQVLKERDFLRGFAKRINKDTNDKCKYCGKTGTSEHTIFERVRWSRNR